MQLEHKRAAYYDFDKSDEMRRKIESRWDEIQSRITDAEARIQELRAETDSWPEEEFERRYSAVLTELNELEKYVTLEDESRIARKFATEFTRFEQVRSFENFMERYPNVLGTPQTRGRTTPGHRQKDA